METVTVFVSRNYRSLLGDQPSAGPVQHAATSQFAEVVVEDDRAGDRKVETGNEAPLRDLDDEIGLVKEVGGNAPAFGTEEKTRSFRVDRIEETDGPLIEFHGNEGVAPLPDVAEERGLVFKETDVRKVLRGLRRRDIPFLLADKQNLRRCGGVGRSDETADIVLLRGFPSRNSNRTEAAAVVLFTACPALDAPGSVKVILCFRGHGLMIAVPDPGNAHWSLRCGLEAKRTFLFPEKNMNHYPVKEKGRGLIARTVSLRIPVVKRCCVSSHDSAMPPPSTVNR